MRKILVGAARLNVATLMFAMIATGCSEAPTGAEPPFATGAPRAVEALVLDPIVTDTCQYGGEYPHCDAMPEAGGGGGSSPTPEMAGGGGGGTSPGSTTANSDSFSQGPLLWGACILGIVGSTVSVYDVAGSFQTWYDAYQHAQGAYNLWQATVQNNADPVTQQLYEFEYRQAYQAQQNAANAVSSATNTSVMTLVGAALACGAAALAPTP